jgi:hypothetical protein
MAECASGCHLESYGTYRLKTDHYLDRPTDLLLKWSERPLTGSLYHSLPENGPLKWRIFVVQDLIGNLVNATQNNGPRTLHTRQ